MPSLRKTVLREKQRLLEKEARKKQKEHIEQYRDEIESEINKEDPNSDLL